IVHDRAALEISARLGALERHRAIAEPTKTKIKVSIQRPRIKEVVAPIGRRRIEWSSEQDRDFFVIEKIANHLRVSQFRNPLKQTVVVTVVVIKPQRK